MRKIFLARVFLTFGLLSILGCATPYRPYQQGGCIGCLPPTSPLRGGYKDQYLGDDIYLITIRVNSYTDETVAYEYFHRRANEIVKKNGYKRYEVIELESSKKKEGGLGYSMPPFYTISIIEKPRVYGRIKCYK